MATNLLNPDNGLPLCPPSIIRKMFWRSYRFSGTYAVKRQEMLTEGWTFDDVSDEDDECGVTKVHDEYDDHLGEIFPEDPVPGFESFWFDDPFPAMKPRRFVSIDNAEFWFSVVDDDLSNLVDVIGITLPPEMIGATNLYYFTIKWMCAWQYQLSCAMSLENCFGLDNRGRPKIVA